MTLNEQITCIKRELRLRNSAYPKWVMQGKMQQSVADKEIEAMSAVLETLDSLDDKGLGI